MPIEKRKKIGSTITEMKMSHMPRHATRLRSSRRSGGDIDAPGSSRVHIGRVGSGASGSTSVRSATLMPPTSA